MSRARAVAALPRPPPRISVKTAMALVIAVRAPMPALDPQRATGVHRFGDGDETELNRGSTRRCDYAARHGYRF
jgi:hypothetical protein